MTTLTTQHARGAGFLAAQLLHRDGLASIFPADIYSKIHFGSNPKGRRQSLERAVATGWLALGTDGAIRLGAPAIEFFTDSEQPSKAYIGKPAGIRDTGSVYDRPPITKKNLPNSRGFRDDVPEFSVRDIPSFRSVGGRAG